MNTQEEKTHEASQAYFNRWAKNYDRSPTQLWFRKNYRLMVEKLSPQQNMHILDVGCGTGIAAQRLSAMIPDGKVLGVDPAEEMVRVANQKATDNLTYKLGTGHEIPASDGEFDVALSTISFHHWTKPSESFNELFRVLKPGGKLLILDLCRDNAIAKINDWIGKRFQRSHYGIAASQEMIQWSESAGFEKIEITRPRYMLMLLECTKP